MARRIEGVEVGAEPAPRDLVEEGLELGAGVVALGLVDQGRVAGGLAQAEQGLEHVDLRLAQALGAHALELRRAHTSDGPGCQPVEWASHGTGYVQSLQDAKAQAEAARAQMARQALQAHQSDTLAQENEALRKLLGLRERLAVPSLAAQILYETADPYTRRVMLDRGQDAGVQPGSPVLDGVGVLGQVTRVFPFVSEVTLVTDRDQAIPVLNARTGARGVAYGDPVASHGGGMELRFVSAHADVQDGDVLATNGLDGVYPAGLPVARVVRVERRADSAFARIYCEPVAATQGARHVLVLQPEALRLPQRPEPTVEEAPVRKKGRK